MPCDDVRHAWLGQRYGGTALLPEQAEHLATCPLCAAYVREAQSLDGMLAHEVNEPPRPGFDTQFFARLQALKTPPHAAPWWRTRWVLGGFAASAVAVLFAVTLGLPRTPAMNPDDMELAVNLDLLQEDLGLMQKLDDVEAYEVLSKLKAEDRVP